MFDKSIKNHLLISENNYKKYNKAKIDWNIILSEIDEKETKILIIILSCMELIIKH